MAILKEKMASGLKKEDKLTGAEMARKKATGRKKMSALRSHKPIRENMTKRAVRRNFGAKGVQALAGK